MIRLLSEDGREMLPSDFSPAAQHPQQLFFPIRNNEATWLATEEKCPGNPGSSVFATVTKKKHWWTWISKHWRDMYYFWLLWKINWCSSIDTNRRKHISLLTFFFFFLPPQVWNIMSFSAWQLVQQVNYCSVVGKRAWRCSCTIKPVSTHTLLVTLSQNTSTE